MVSVAVEKVDRQMKADAKKFVILVGLVSSALVAIGITMAIHASVREGYGFFAFFGIVLALGTTAFVAPVLVRTIKSGKIS